MFYVWLGIAVGLAVLEMATVNLVSIWFVISAILAMISSLIISNVVIQIAIFVITGIILLIFTKDAVKKLLPTKTKTNIDRIIGTEGIVTEKITKKESGEVKVDGKKWTAIANETINEGESVKILSIESTKLKVERMEE